MNEKLATLATEAATSILTPLGFEFKLETQPYEDSVQIMIESPDARFLIGEEGDRLDDLQYLVNRLVQAQWETAPRELSILLEMIPDRDDNRNREASAKLIDVEKRMKGGK